MNDLLYKIIDMLPEAIRSRIPLDKIAHFFVGAAIGVAGFLIWGPLGAIVAAGIAGVIKEIVDYIQNEMAIKRGEAPPHGVEFLDALATTLGGVLVFAVAKLFGF